MMKRFLYPSISFLAAFILHAIYSISKSIQIFKQRGQIEGINFLLLYFKQQDYFLGISYALAVAFTVYAFLKFLQKQRSSIVGMVSGLTLTGVLYFLGCFLVGCCGSPMFLVYLGLFGPSILGFTKLFILIFTVASVIISYLWMKKKSKTQDICCIKNEVDIDVRTMTVKDAINKIQSELARGIKLVKCKKCGCMKETLESLQSLLFKSRIENHAGLLENIKNWLKQTEPIKYSCLGCKYCFPAVAMSVFNQTIGSVFEVEEKTWPAVPGEYFAFCHGLDCPVAVSTLGSSELAERLANIRPRELCIVGKTETENIGIDKVIKNTVTNPTIRFLILAGKDPDGHHSGKTLFALWKNGVDKNMRVINSPGKHPILRNVLPEEVEAFRKQIEVVDLLECEDTKIIVEKIKELSHKVFPLAEIKPIPISTATVIQAKESKRVEIDTGGYFVIIPQPIKGIITVEHYSYDNKLLRVIEGKDTKSIYSTIIDNGWITNLSHAAYLGKELTKAELSLKLKFKYIQDGA